MVTLQQHFSSMEETVRTLLQNQDSLEGSKVDPLDLMKAYKDKLLEEMWKQQDSLEGPAGTEAETAASPEAGGGVEENTNESNSLLERLRALEAENSALSMENDSQRKQYERCLDEVANQVVQALLTQKDLKEECVKLRTRVFDLEQQNRILSVLFQQRVKMSTNPVSQEVQRNGKAGIPAGRWPSLLSLTCPRSSGSGSGSGSEVSLSSTCSEYSSGSHTWADARGFSKQCATGRERRKRTGSISGNHPAHVDQSDLGWKEGHILKGLKRLQMSSSKDSSSQGPVPHCKDCMAANEGVYSLGVKCGEQGLDAKPGVSVGKAFKAGQGITALDSDDAEADSNKFQSQESSGQPTKECLCLEKLNVTGDNIIPVINFQEEPVKLVPNSGHFPSPVTDNYLFLEGPTVKPGVSPTENLTHMHELNNKDSLEKHRLSGVKLNDRNNNQERSTDRKSRLDHVKRQQVRLGFKQAEAGTSNMISSIQHTATRALNCVNEARQRSSSMDIPHSRDEASQIGSDSKDYTILEAPQAKLKPELCDSARKAFILRSKSADGGPEQAKHVQAPLHQKLIKVQRSKAPANCAGHSVPCKRPNLSKTQCSGKGSFSKLEKSEDPAEPRTSESLESVRQCSPLASPVKPPKALKPVGGSECSLSLTKSPRQIRTFPSIHGSEDERTPDNSPCSPLRQRRQEQQFDASHSELRSPSPPPPPGRTTSLLIRPGCEPFPNVQKPKSSTTGKMQPQHSNSAKDNHHTAAQMVAEAVKSPKEVPVLVYHTHSSGIANSIPGQDSQGSHSVQMSTSRTGTCHDEHFGPSILTNPSILQRSHQSISEPKLSEVSPQACSNIYCHGIDSNSASWAVRSAINAKSLEANCVQGSSFLVLGRLDKDDTDVTTKAFQTFETFTRDSQMIHGVSENGAQNKGRRKIETRCSSLDSEPSFQPVTADSGVMLDWGFDEEGWLFKRSVSVSTRPPLKPVMGMNGAKARSQSFGARYMDRPSFNRSGKVRTQIKTHSGSSLNSLGDVLPGSMSCSSSYHCPMNRSLLNNFLIEEGLSAPLHLGSSNERLQSIKHQREQARRLQIEQQFSSAFGEPVSEEPERQSTITTIEEKVMIGIEENLHKTQEQERSIEVKQKSGSALANWFGFRKSKLPAPSGKKTDPPKAKEEKREQKITSLLGGKQAKSDKKRDKRKSDGKDSSAARRESHDAVRACISMPGPSLNDIQGHIDIIGDPKVPMMNERADSENGSALKSPGDDAVIGSGCKMRTLDSGIGTIPLPESCSFFSSILHLLPKSSSNSDQPLSPPSAPTSSSEDVSPSPLPRWRIPSSFKDGGRMPNSLSDFSMTHIHSVPLPTVAFLQPIQPQSAPFVTTASVCVTQSRLPRPAADMTEPKKLTYVKSKSRATPSQQKEPTRLQLAN
ncbi:nck-associated protein 5-like [Genypterus blacodes]|uniref:nck-associated protein 5-like n=1 Tax=Genypterus blacodes TaxID=154954 RepID=UPI003F75D0E0